MGGLKGSVATSSVVVAPTSIAAMPDYALCGRSRFSNCCRFVEIDRGECAPQPFVVGVALLIGRC
jgi:hypothetical protein